MPLTSLPTCPEVTGTSEGKICINCSFSDHIITGCVGIIHSAELKDPLLMIHSVKRPDYSSKLSHNYSCIHVPIQEHGNHRFSVAVFGQLRDRLEEAPATVSVIDITIMPTIPTTSISELSCLSHPPMILLYMICHFTVAIESDSLKIHCLDQITINFLFSCVLLGLSSTETNRPITDRQAGGYTGAIIGALVGKLEVMCI